MTRLPPGHPGLWSENDGGGAADLQTDVMRFMAILAFCLVAIFALVQAIPLESPAAPPPAPEAGEQTPAAVAAPAPAIVAKPPPAAPRPAADPPPPATPVPAPSPPATPSVTRSPEAGFTLRFESDDALKSLVAREEVGLYALQGDEARRLHVASGRLEFWKASTPGQFHEMDPVTVPRDVAGALARTGPVDTAVRWGVTLPPRLAREIDRRIGQGGAGDLVIAANGALRQE